MLAGVLAIVGRLKGGYKVNPPARREIERGKLLAEMQDGGDLMMGHACGSSACEQTGGPDRGSDRSSVASGIDALEVGGGAGMGAEAVR